MFTPSRLAVARKRRGLTITALSQATDVSTHSLSAFENGKKQPAEGTLLMLANRLDVAPAFLTAPEIDEVPVDAVSFRALSKMTARQRDAALSSGRLAILINDWLEARFELPQPDIPSLTGRDPESAAEIVRARWGLGERPVGNLLHLIEAHGVRVYSLTGDNAQLDAYSLYWRTQPFVFLSTLKSGERGRFDAAHELGHLVLHCEHQVPHGPEAELAANRFAAAFLMPRASVLAAGLRNATVDRILRAKRTWNVAAMALTHRLNELGLLTEWGYRSSCVQLSRMGYRRGEPDGIQRESSQLLRKVLQQLRDDRVGIAEVARDLGLSADELRSHLFGLTLTAVRS